MKAQQIILIEDDVYLHQEFINLKSKKKLSNHINNLLRVSFNINKNKESAEEDELDNKILKLNIEKGILENKKKILEENKEKEANKWKTLL